MRLLRVIWALWLASGAVVAKKSKPEIHKQEFESDLNLFFFDDSEVLIGLDYSSGIVYRSKDGGEKMEAVEEIDKGDAFAVYQHPYDNKVAVTLGKNLKHWITEDQGKSWHSFETSAPPTLEQAPLNFHATDSKRILFNLESNQPFEGIGKTMYTTDGFKNIETLHPRRKICMWGQSHDQFTTGDKQKDQDLIVCIVEGKRSSSSKDYRLVTTTDFFDSEKEPTMANGRNVAHMTNMASVKGFLVGAAKAGNSKEMALYVTKNGEQWHRAEFGEHRLEEDAYTILESTNYSLQVDVVTDKRGRSGILFTSNSNGTYFKENIEHLNRNRFGFVDFEKIESIQGIVLVNEIDNWDQYVDDAGVDKAIKSKISFNDGRTWDGLKADGDELHLHSVIEQLNSGRIFSSPAPGMAMGNGNTGDHLQSYESASLYVSDNAGQTWRKSGLSGPQKYEFGDQGGILVAVAEGKVDEISWSIDHGRTWKQHDLPEKGVVPIELTTIPDSTSLKFVLVAQKGEKYYLFSIDFDDLHERKCGDGDFEKWYARVDDKGEAQCLMGHKQWFDRRKADAECFVKKEFKESLPQSEQCECTDADFECDYNFRPTADGKECEVAGKVLDPESECKDRDSKFKGSSGWRLIPGNDCKRSSDKQKDDPVERECGDVIKSPASGQIEVSKQSFSGKSFVEIFYLERDANAQGDDETVVVLTDIMEAWITHDQGKKWKKAVDDDVIGIYPHQYNNDFVYFITRSSKVFYSEDRGKAINEFDAPSPPNRQSRPIMGFHQRNPRWIIWTGAKDCGRDAYDGKCHNVAHVSRHNGADWETLLRYVQKCQFMYQEGRSDSEDLIYCEQYQAEDTKSPLQLLSTEDDFKHTQQQFSDIVDFASMAEFIVVAEKVDNNDLQAKTSIDGRTFAHAAWPANFAIKHETAYTVLDSSTNAVFIHVTVNSNMGNEYGSILKSNSNGTSYVLSLADVNRNRDGYVDFEKMQGIEGVALANVVSNSPDVDGGANKRIKSVITHDDGSFWAPLPPPATNLDDQKYCSGEDVSKCSLHLHGYTERNDPRDSFSSPSAVGLMVGIGNVGEFLESASESDTFLTKDGGVSWSQIQKGTYMWEYGDQGSIIVLVPKDKPTDTLLFSVDEGAKWQRKDFSDRKVTIDKISTVPSDGSRTFILWGREEGKLTTWRVDFTGLTSKQCVLNKEDPTAKDSDYDLWSPIHPHKDDQKDCLFGHKSRYYRKKADRECYNGPMIERLHDIERNCTCTRQDFEWYVVLLIMTASCITDYSPSDFNYERATHGECLLISGLSPADPLDVCRKDSNAIEYHEITGYRKVPISTCAGNDMSFAAPSHPCPGHEEQYKEKHGLSGIALLFVILLPIAAGVGAGYWVWNNWEGKFGQIRLGEAAGLGGRGGESPWIKWPVAAISAVVAVVAALPLLAASLWRSVRGGLPSRRGGYGQVPTYSSRGSFARGRSDYSAVEDEGELLGDDSEDEV